MFVWVQKYEKASCVQKYYICNPATCTWKNDKYLRITIDNPVFTCDEIIEVTKTV